MEIHTDIIDGTPRASSTIVMLRDAPAGAGVEVFLLKRHGLSDVLGGAYVFPGGKVDLEDAELVGALDLPPAELRTRLAEPAMSEAEAVALHAAAIREAFEETGVLYADVASGAVAALGAALREGRGFVEVVEDAGLRLHASALVPWSRWITPLAGGVMRKRFDTRFFVAAVPPGQSPVHDERESTDGLWVAPGQALRQYWAGEIELAPPQIMSLVHLTRHRDVADVLARARTQPPPLIQPEPFQEDGARVLCYPGDPRHPVPARALPGPSRLRWRNGRFEPDGGLAALLEGEPPRG